MPEPKFLHTRRGQIPLPAYVPVTTFGNKYPLDKLIQPYLPRLASAMMVSYYYAKQIDQEPRLPLFVDSGGFASLFENAKVKTVNGLGVLEITNEEKTEKIHPREVLDLQERIADVAFTLDFPIPPGMDKKEAHHRFDLTIKNAYWALENRKRKDLLLYACIQAWDAESAKECAKAYKDKGFDGVAIGGLVPRAKDRNLINSIIEAVRSEIVDLPIHVFGLGNPEIVKLLFENGVNSVDSSAYIKLAADGCLWGKYKQSIYNPSTFDRLHLAICNLAIASGDAMPLIMTTHLKSILTHTI